MDHFFKEGVLSPYFSHKILLQDFTYPSVMHALIIPYIKGNFGPTIINKAINELNPFILQKILIKEANNSEILLDICDYYPGIEQIVNALGLNHNFSNYLRTFPKDTQFYYKNEENYNLGMGVFEGNNYYGKSLTYLRQRL